VKSFTTEECSPLTLKNSTFGRRRFSSPISFTKSPGNSQNTSVLVLRIKCAAQQFRFLRTSPKAVLARHVLTLPDLLKSRQVRCLKCCHKQKFHSINNSYPKPLTKKSQP